MKKYMDHCRIGSLEKTNNATSTGGIGSLPHRQLRKVVSFGVVVHEVITAA